jgi:hypothetical protein
MNALLDAKQQSIDGNWVLRSFDADGAVTQFNI